jgi:hypothetical protein
MVFGVKTSLREWFHVILNLSSSVVLEKKTFKDFACLIASENGFSNLHLILPWVAVILTLVVHHNRELPCSVHEKEFQINFFSTKTHEEIGSPVVPPSTARRHNFDKLYVAICLKASVEISNILPLWFLRRFLKLSSK